MNKFRLNITDPTLNNIFSALVDDRRDEQGNHIKPAFSANKPVEEDDGDDVRLPEVISCDVSCLDEVDFLDVSEDSACMAFIRPLFYAGFPSEGSFIDIREAFLAVMDYVATDFDTFMYSDPACAGEAFDMYIVFDDKLPIPWGRALFDADSEDIAFERLHFTFPTEFSSFSVALYSTTNDVFYDPIRYSTSA